VWHNQDVVTAETILDYEGAVAYLDSLISYERLLHLPERQPYKLERMRRLLEAMGLPKPEQRFVQIAGTKGKGSTAAMVEAILLAAGLRTGLFTSPHLHRVEERIRLEGNPLQPSLFAAAAAAVRSAAERATPPGESSVTYFEALNAMALWAFAKAGSDLGILEVGLGGRLDSTSAIEPVAVAITHIGLDHTEVLGPTLAQIASEKAGVIRPRSIVVCSAQAEEARKVICRTAAEQAALLFLGGIDFVAEPRDFAPTGTTFSYRGLFEDFERAYLPLIGPHQVENAGTALALCECLREFCGVPLSGEAMLCGLAALRWPARGQILWESPVVLVDGAHNPTSAGALARTIRLLWPEQQVVLVLGTSLDKDLPGIVAALAPICARAVATQSRHPRARPAEEVAQALRAAGLQTESVGSVEAAVYQAAAGMHPNELLCITGSLFVAAEAIRAWPALLDRLTEAASG